MQVPIALCDMVDWQWGICDGAGEEYGLHPEEVAELKELVDHTERADRREHPGRNDSRLVMVTTEAASDARNCLDGLSLSYECDPDDHDGGCHWCKALIARDWLDRILDDAGFTDRSPYIGTVDPDWDPIAEWERADERPIWDEMTPTT